MRWGLRITGLALLASAIGCGGRAALGPAAPPGSPAASTAATAPTAMAEHRPMILIVHADWCAACKRVAPVVAWLHEEYGDRVDIVELDVTDDAASARSAAAASRAGLGRFFAANDGQPGITIVGKNGPVKRFTVEIRTAPYRSALADALATFDVPR